MAHAMMSRHFCDPALLHSLGSIAAESAYLERFVETLLYVLTGMTRDMGHVVIEKNMIDGKVDLLREIGKAKLKKRKKLQNEFLEIISRIKAANSERVTAIHGVWLPPDPSINELRNMMMLGGRAVAHKRGRLDKPDTFLKAERAEEVAKLLSDVQVELRDFVDRAWPKAYDPESPRFQRLLRSLSPPESRKGAKKTSSPQ